MEGETDMINETDVLTSVLGLAKGGLIDLRKIPNDKADPGVDQLLISGEKIIGAYQTVRDQLIFTNKRIISVDSKSLTGKRKEYFSLPYSKVQYYGVQTPGAIELIQDTELSLVFNNGMTAHFEFKGKNDIMEIGRVISEYVL